MTTPAPYVSAPTQTLAQYLASSLVNLQFNHLPNSQDFIQLLTQYAQENQQIFLELSQVHPDFESIKQQFNTELIKSDAWRDIIQASGGGTVVDFISSIGAYGQAGIAVALQENQLDTAGLDSSIYTIMRGLGVYIKRKRPAQLPVTLTKTLNQTVVIPSLTQWFIGNNYYFNRETIVLEAGNVSTDALFYQGTLQSVAFVSTGAPFQRLEIGNSDYQVSDTDVYCFQPDGTEYQIVQDGLWKYGADAFVMDSNTTPEGNVEIKLGNDLYGKIPPVNSLCAFIYAKVNGTLGNGFDSGGLGAITAFNSYVPDRIQLSSDAETSDYQKLVAGSVKALATANSFNGEDPYDKEFYRNVGPYINSGKKGMIRKSEHYAVGLQYPGVVDILFQNQRDIDPYDRNLINVVWITPLMKNGVPMNNTQWLDFQKYLEKNEIWRQDWVLKQPEAVPIDITATLYVDRRSNLGSVVPLAELSLAQNLGIRRGALGASGDLDQLRRYLTLVNKGAFVDIVDLQLPTQSITLTPRQYFVPRNIALDAQYSKANSLFYSPPNQVTQTLLP